MFPFDDYSQKTKIENIFYDKTGRGGNIGIKSVDWRTIGTNQSNVSQVRVSIKINIQDIQDIETKRNGVSLLDLLYPAGTRNNDEYDDKNFNIKLKLGWLYKMNPSLSSLDAKINSQLLQEVIFVSLYKHEFEFTEAGSVLLSLEYIGMLETKLSNPYKYDILDRIVPSKKTEKRKLDSVKYITNLLGELHKANNNKNKEEILKYKEKIIIAAQEANVENLVVHEDMIYLPSKGEPVKIGIEEYDRVDEVFDAGGSDGKTLVMKPGWRTEGDFYIGPGADTLIRFDLNNLDPGIIDVIVSKIAKGYTTADVDDSKDAIELQEEKLANSYVESLQGLLESLSNRNSIKYLILDGKTVENLKSLSTIESTIISKGTMEKVIDSLNATTGSIDNAEKLERNSEENIKSSFKDPETVQIEDDKITINKDLIIDQLTIGADSDTIVVPYTFLGEVLSHYSKLLFPENAISNKEIRLVLGDFSYRDIGDLQEDERAAGTSRPKTKKEYRTKNKDGVTVQRYSTDKKYASLADIPVSIDSLISWYNENIADQGIEKLSYHSFLRSVFSNLIPANLTNQVLDINIGTSRTILTSFNYLDIKEDKNLEKQLLKAKGNKTFIEVDFSNKNAKKSKFYKIKSRSNFKQTRNVQMQNYLFILSSNENEYDSLKGNYRSDKAKDIFHFYVGEDKGLVKNIKFVKEDNPGLDAANVLKANQGDSHQAIIRRIYQGDVTLFGNTIFTPGQLIFLEPTYPGARLRNKTLQRVGLGGYYRIIEVENYIEDNKFETKLKTKWQASGFGIETESTSIEVVEGEGGVQEEDREIEDMAAVEQTPTYETDGERALATQDRANKL